MNAILFNELGGSEKMYYGTAPKPKITKPSEILVRVKAATINPADFLYSAGYYAYRPTSFPATLGLEGAGIIEETGGATGLYTKGQRISFFALGCWAEYVVIDTAASFPGVLPDGLGFDQGAQLTINPLTAYGIFDTLGIKAGETLIQNAASSACGKLVIQFAKQRGVKTINIVRRDEHIAPLKALGADYVINSEKEDFLKRVAEIAPKGVEYALDSIMGQSGTDLFKTLAYAGKGLIYGALSRVPQITIDVSITLKTNSIVGFHVERWVKEHVPELQQVTDNIAKGVLTKNIQLPFKSFEAKTELAAAVQHAEAANKHEKTVLLF